MTTGAALPALLSAVLFLLAGRGVLQLVPRLRERSLSVRMAWAWLLGVAAMGSLLWAASHLFHLSLGRKLIGSAFAALALLRLVPARTRPSAAAPRFRLPLPRRLAVGATALVCGLVAAGVAAESVTEVARDNDGLMTWDAAARWVRAERDAAPLVLREPLWYVTHPQYPLLLPLMQAAPQTGLATTDDMRVVRPLYAAFFAALLLILYDAASRRAGRTAAALATLAFALAPFVSSNVVYGGAGSTYSDIPLAALWGGGLLLLLEPGLTVRTAAAAGLLLGGTVLAKNEGAPYAVIALAVAAGACLVEARRRGQTRTRALLPVAAAALVTSAAFALLVSWASRIPNRHDEDYAARLTNPAAVHAAWARLPLFPDAMATAMSDDAWANLWLVLPVVLAAGWPAFLRRGAWPVLLAPAAAFVVLLVAYGVTPWPDTDLVGVTFGRFLLQMSIPLFVLLAMALTSALRETRTFRDSIIRSMSRWRIRTKALRARPDA